MNIELNKRFLATKTGKKFQRVSKIVSFLNRIKLSFKNERQLAFYGTPVDTDDAPSLARTLGISLPEAAKIINTPAQPQTLPGPTCPWDNRNVEIHTVRGIYKRKGFESIDFKPCGTACGYRVERKENGKTIQVILSQLRHNRGTSLTNMYADFATDIYWLFLFRTPIQDIEWYEYWSPACNKSMPPSLIKVILIWENEKFIWNGGRVPMEIPKDWLTRDIP